MSNTVQSEVAAQSTAVFDEESIRNTVRELILELAPTESIKELKPEHQLVQDLGYHSLALMEMAFTLEDEFGLDPIDEEQAQKISTAKDIETYVVEQVRRKRSGA